MALDLTNELIAQTYGRILQIDGSQNAVGIVPFDIDQARNSDVHTLHNGIAEKHTGIVIDHTGNGNGGLFLKNTTSQLFGIQVESLQGEKGMLFWRTYQGTKLFLKHTGTVWIGFGDDTFSDYGNHSLFVNEGVYLRKTGDRAFLRVGDPIPGDKGDLYIKAKNYEKEHYLTFEYGPGVAINNRTNDEYFVVQSPVEANSPNPMNRDYQDTAYILRADAARVNNVFGNGQGPRFGYSSSITSSEKGLRLEIPKLKIGNILVLAYAEGTYTNPTIGEIENYITMAHTIQSEDIETFFQQFYNDLQSAYESIVGPNTFPNYSPSSTRLRLKENEFHHYMELYTNFDQRYIFGPDDGRRPSEPNIIQSQHPIGANLVPDYGQTGTHFIWQMEIAAQNRIPDSEKTKTNERQKIVRPDRDILDSGIYARYRHDRNRIVQTQIPSDYEGNLIYYVEWQRVGNVVHCEGRRVGNEPVSGTFDVSFPDDPELLPVITENSYLNLAPVYNYIIGNGFTRAGEYVEVHPNTSSSTYCPANSGVIFKWGSGTSFGQPIKNEDTDVYFSFSYDLKN